MAISKSERTRSRSAFMSTFIVAGLLLSGCASTHRESENLAPILPASESRLESASPDARDALDEGMRWIAQDAPRTQVHEASESNSSGKDQNNES